MAKNSIYIHFPPELGSLEALYIKSLSHPTALLFHNQESAKAQLTVALLIATQAGAGRFVNDGEAVHFIVDKDGWLHTGDLARRTPEGNYKITGRIKDMIIRGGENIYPKEIEDFIYTHPKVRDVQVIGVPDEQYGEEIMACVILKEGETSSEEEIKAYVRDHMAKHKVPRYVTFVQEFPMNAAGKILKYKMREDAVEYLKLQKADSIVTA